MPARILVVDDEPLIALDVESLLMDAGFDVVATARDMEGARATLQSGRVDLVVLDADLNGESSAPLAEQLRRDGIPFVVASGYSAAQLQWLGSTPLLAKPIDQDRLIASVSKILDGRP